MREKYDEKQKAFTLIEAILTFVAIAIISIIAFQIYKEVELNMRAQKQSEEMRVVQSIMRSRHPSGKYFVPNVGMSDPRYKLQSINGYGVRNVDLNQTWQWNYPTNYFLIQLGLNREMCAKLISKAQASFGRVMIMPGGAQGSFNIDGKSYRSLVKNDFVAPPGAPNGYAGKIRYREDSVVQLCNHRDTAVVTFMSS